MKRLEILALLVILYLCPRASAENVILISDDIRATFAGKVENYDSVNGLVWSYTLPAAYAARTPRTGYLDNAVPRRVHIAIDRLNSSGAWTELAINVSDGGNPIFTDRDSDDAPTFGRPDLATSDILCSCVFNTSNQAFIQWNRTTGARTYHHFDGPRRVWTFRRSTLRNSIVGFDSYSQNSIVEYVPASNTFNFLPAPGEGYFSVIQEFACPLAASGYAWAITSNVAIDYLAAEVGTNPDTWADLGGGTAASEVIDRSDGLYVLGDTTVFEIRRINKSNLTIDWHVSDGDPEPKVLDTTTGLVWFVNKHSDRLYLQALRRSNGSLYSEFDTNPFDGNHDAIQVIGVGPALGQ